jgi:hypothetical protein
MSINYFITAYKLYKRKPNANCRVRVKVKFRGYD